MRKKFIFIVLLLLLSHIPFVPTTTTSAQLPEWTIKGDTVYIDDSKVYIAASPHTLNASGYVYLNVTSKVFEGSVDLCFGFNSDYFTPRSLELHKQDGTWLNLAEKLDFERVLKNYGEMNTWFITSANVVKDREYYLRIFIELKPYLTKGDPVVHKYFIALKPSAETLGEAITNEHLYCLDPWLTGGWDKQVKFTVDSGDVDGALSDFPLLLNISTSSGINSEDISFIFDELTSDANQLKIAVTESDGTTECYVEVEKWDDANELAQLWVKGPTIASGSNTDFYLYYDKDHANNSAYVGNPNSTAAENVWDSDFKFVSHMRDDPDTSNIRDSTTEDNDGAKSGAGAPSLLVSGLIGESQDFESGSSEYISLGTGINFGSSDFTVEAWVQLETVQAQLLYDNRDGDNDGIRVLLNDDGTIYFSVNAKDVAAALGLNDLDPHYVVCVADVSANGVIYVDGSAAQTTDISGCGSVSVTNPLLIGKNGYAAQNYLDGVVDEARVSLTIRNAAWVKASYETSRDHLLDWGSEVFLMENTDCTTTNMDDVDNLYAQYRNYTIFYQGKNSTAVSEIHVNFTQSSTVRFSFKWDGSTNTFSLLEGSTYVGLETTLSSSTYASQSINLTIAFNVLTTATNEDDLEIIVYITDGGTNTDTDTIQTNYCDIIAIGCMYAEISNIEVGNYVYTENPTFYQFVGYYFVVDSNDTCRLSFNDGNVWMNVSYDVVTQEWSILSGSGYVSIVTVESSTSGLKRTVTWYLYLENTAADANDLEIYLWCNSTIGVYDGWDEVRTDYFHIFNVGGGVEYSFDGDGEKIYGGGIFGIAATSSATNSWARVNITWRNFQHMRALFHLYDNSTYDAGNGYWNCPSEHKNTGYYEFGVDYYLDDQWIEGWKVRLEIEDGAAGPYGLATGQEWVRLKAEWYNRGVLQTTDYFYGFYEAYQSTDEKTQIGVWVDLWIGIENASSVVCGRVSPEYYGMNKSGWGPWTTWKPRLGLTEQSSYIDDFLDSANAITSAPQVELYKIYAIVNKTAAGGGNPNCTIHQWAIIDVNVLDWLTTPITETHQGITTPMYTPPALPDVTSPGFFSTLATSLVTGIMVPLLRALRDTQESLYFAFASIINAAFSFFGFTNFVSSITTFITGLITYLSTSLTNVRLLIVQVFTILATMTTTLVSWFTSLTSTFITISEHVVSILDGTNTIASGIGDIWTIIAFNTWSDGVPVFIAIAWMYSIDNRARRMGGGWNSIFWGDLQIAMGILGFLLDMFSYIINVTIDLVFKVINALPLT